MQDGLTGAGIPEPEKKRNATHTEINTQRERGGGGESRRMSATTARGRIRNLCPMLLVLGWMGFEG